MLKGDCSANRNGKSMLCYVCQSAKVKDIKLVLVWYLFAEVGGREVVEEEVDSVL